MGLPEKSIYLRGVIITVVTETFRGKRRALRRSYTFRECIAAVPMCHRLSPRY